MENLKWAKSIKTKDFPSNWHQIFKDFRNEYGLEEEVGGGLNIFTAQGIDFCSAWLYLVKMSSLVRKY